MVLWPRLAFVGSHHPLSENTVWTRCVLHRNEDHPATFMAKIFYPSVLLGRIGVFGVSDDGLGRWIHPRKRVTWMAPENRGPPGKGDSYWKPSFFGSMLVIGGVIYNYWFVIQMTSSLAVPFHSAFWMSQQTRRFKSKDFEHKAAMILLSVTCSSTSTCASTCDFWGIFLPPVLYGGYRQVKKTQKASEPCELLADEEHFFGEWRAGRGWVIPNVPTKA